MRGEKYGRNEPSAGLLIRIASLIHYILSFSNETFWETCICEDWCTVVMVDELTIHLLVRFGCLCVHITQRGMCVFFLILYFLLYWGSIQYRIQSKFNRIKCGPDQREVEWFFFCIFLIRIYTICW